MKYKLLIGAIVRHGSPGYENEEIITRIFTKDDHVIVEFKSGCFTKMKHEDIDFFVEHGSSDYIRHESNAFESMIFIESNAFESMIFIESVRPTYLEKH